MTIRIAPSILAADLLRLGEEVRTVEQAGADRLHLDVMDGLFVPNISFGVPMVRAVRAATRLPVEVHLMVDRPERHLEAFVEAGASTLIVHREGAPHLHRTLARIRELGARPGVVINPATPAEALSEVVDLVDLILVMTVDPGFGGQELIEGVLPKIGRVASKVAEANPRCEVEADGGIGPDNAPDLIAAGATVLVAGSSVFGSDQGTAAGFRSLAAAAGADRGRP